LKGYKVEKQVIATAQLMAIIVKNCSVNQQVPAQLKNTGR